MHILGSFSCINAYIFKAYLGHNNPVHSHQLTDPRYDVSMAPCAVMEDTTS
jgi:hypothetical protein